MEKYGLLEAPALIDSRQKTVGVCMLNPHDKNIYLRKGTTIGIGQTVEVWETSPQDVSATVVNQQVAYIAVKAEPPTDRCAPGYLSDLLHRSSKHLDETQTGKVRSLFYEYADSFAKNDSDLGRTDKVKHHINTGDAPLIEIPPH